MNNDVTIDKKVLIDAKRSPRSTSGFSRPVALFDPPTKPTTKSTQPEKLSFSNIYTMGTNQSSHATTSDNINADSAKLSPFTSVACEDGKIFADIKKIESDHHTTFDILGNALDNTDADHENEEASVSTSETETSLASDEWEDEEEEDGTFS